MNRGAKHRLMVAARSDVPLIGQAPEIAGRLCWEEDINHLATDLASNPDHVYALRAVFADQRSTKVFIREMRFCLGLQRRPKATQ